MLYIWISERLYTSQLCAEKEQHSIIVVNNAPAIDATTGDARKPEIITLYNHTKCGVDIVDRMCHQYDVSRNSRCWPITLFFNFLNVADINGLVIHQLNNSNEKIIRRL